MIRFMIPLQRYCITLRGLRYTFQRYCIPIRGERVMLNRTEETQGRRTEEAVRPEANKPALARRWCKATGKTLA